MRIVTYARVSTKSQQDRGTSLDDQESRFSAWLKRSDNTRVQAYKESKSGGDVAHRKQFLAMLEDIPGYDPSVDAVVVDSLDRFTRNKFLGIEVLAKMREMDVKLWELEYSEERALDLTVDDDRDYVWSKFQDAEAERRRIQKRQKKRYAEQRNRGAATTNRPAFGLLLAEGERGRRRLVRDPATASIVNEVDQRILEGESHNKVLEWLKGISGAWRSRRGLTIALRDKHGAYVRAGVRTPETQSQLREMLGKHKQSYGPDRTTRSRRIHEWSGLVACYRCVRAGCPPEKTHMHGRYTAHNKNPYALVCDGRRSGVRIHDEFQTSVLKVLYLILEKMERLRDPDVAEMVLRRWEREPQKDRTANTRRSLERQLSECDEEEAQINARIDAAMNLVAKGGTIAAEAERTIDRSGNDRLALAARREALALKLAQIPVSRAKKYDIGALQREAEAFPMVEQLGSVEGIEAWLNDKGELEFSGSNMPSIREWFKMWVKAIGPPQLLRKEFNRKRPQLELLWPYLDRMPRLRFEHDPEAYDSSDTVKGWTLGGKPVI